MAKKPAKFKSFGEYVLAIKKASDSNGKTVDDRLEINTDVVRVCPNCSENAEGILGKLHSCPECGSLWKIL